MHGVKEVKRRQFSVDYLCRYVKRGLDIEHLRSSLRT